MRVTHGCVRMYPKDVEQIFSSVRVGTPVHIVNQPYKVGVAHGNVYLEVHPHLEEDKDKFRDQFSHVVELIVAQTTGQGAQIDLERAAARGQRENGDPPCGRARAGKPRRNRTKPADSPRPIPGTPGRAEAKKKNPALGRGSFRNVEADGYFFIVCSNIRSMRSLFSLQQRHRGVSCALRTRRGRGRRIRRIQRLFRGARGRARFRHGAARLGLDGRELLRLYGSASCQSPHCNRDGQCLHDHRK